MRIGGRMKKSEDKQFLRDIERGKVATVWADKKPHMALRIAIIHLERQMQNWHYLFCKKIQKIKDGADKVGANDISTIGCFDSVVGSPQDMSELQMCYNSYHATKMALMILKGEHYVVPKYLKDGIVKVGHCGSVKNHSGD